MKRIILSAGILLFSLAFANAQQTQTVPNSFFQAATEITYPTEILGNLPDIKPLNSEDIEREKRGMFYRTGIILPMNTITEQNGKWEYLADGSVTWRIAIKAPNAKALGLYFNYFELPADGQFYVYNPQKTHLVGPFTAENSNMGDVFATAPVMGDEIILEYNGSANTAADFHIELNELGYNYRDGGFGPKNAGDFGSSDPCEVNANCSEGDAWDAQRRSAVKVIVRDGSASGLCSGAMINSVNTDCTPYVLTANHCGGGASVTNYRQWIFYFNFETPNCTNPASATNLDDQIVTGCMKMSNSSDVSDVIASDFLLVHLKNRPANSFNAYMAGWSRSTTASGSGVSIHHPAGDVKKISTYSATLTNSGWSGGNFGKHWGVKWVATANGHGVTEGGSSGSPIFNSAGQIVGDLSGGSSFCTNTNGQDVYGKFSYSWDQTGTTANRRLKDWLDKANSNPQTLAGKEVSSCASAALPTVDFIADNLTPSVGQLVNLTNQSTGTAAGYEWVIAPTTFTYLNGTTKNSENPQVMFSGTTSYSVTLQVYNTAGYNIKTRSNYIKPHNTASIEEAADTQAPVLFPNPSSDGSFQIFAKEAELIESVIIYDLNGKVLLSRNANDSALFFTGMNLAQGMYVVKIQTNKGMYTEKLIIE